MLYNTPERTTFFLKQVMCLGLLPAAHIAAAFDELWRETNNLHRGTVELMEYMERTWRQKVDDWVVYGMDTRTNNSIEGRNDSISFRKTEVETFAISNWKN